MAKLLKKEKSILFIIHSLDSGGIRNVVFALSSSFIKFGYKVTILSLTKTIADNENKFLKSGIKTIRLPLSSKFLVLSPIPLFLYLLKNSNYEIIFIPGIVNAILTLPVIKIFMRKPSRIIVNAHTCFSAYYKTISLPKRIFIKLGRYSLKWVDIIASDSIGASEDLKNFFQLKKVYTFYNPVADQLDLNFKENKNNAPHDWLKDKNLTTFVTCGRHVKSKNFSYMLEIFQNLLKKRNDLRLILIGKGPETDNLIQLTKDLKIDDKVDFSGYVNSPKQYMYHADYFWLTSKFEGFSLVLGEALSMGTPCIVNDCPFGPAEVIEKGKYGLLLNNFDPKINTEEILKFLDQVIKLKKFYRNRAKDFLSDKIAKNYLDVINNVS